MGAPMRRVLGTLLATVLAAFGLAAATTAPAQAATARTPVVFVHGFLVDDTLWSDVPRRRAREEDEARLERWRHPFTAEQLLDFLRRGDYLAVDALLSDEERDIRDTVRAFAAAVAEWPPPSTRGTSTWSAPSASITAMATTG